MSAPWEMNRDIVALSNRIERRKREDMNPKKISEEDIKNSSLPEEEKAVHMRNLKSLKTTETLTSLVLWGGGPARQAAPGFCDRVDLLHNVHASSWVLETKEDSLV